MGDGAGCEGADATGEEEREDVQAGRGGAFVVNDLKTEGEEEYDGEDDEAGEKGSSADMLADRKDGVKV